MARFKFISDAGIQLPEIKQKGAHTANKSRKEEDENDTSINTAAADRLAQQVFECEIPVSDLRIQVEDETVYLSGTVGDQESREKLILLVGNVQGISEVNEEVVVEKEGEEAHFHTVTNEDNLEIIAEKYLDSGNRVEEIINANSPFLNQEADVYPGMVIRIPHIKS